MRPPPVQRASLWLLAYLVAVVLGRQAVLPDTRLALFWPAAGVAALWLTTSPTRRTLAADVALLAGGTAAYFLVVDPMPLPEAVLLGVANTAQGLVVRGVLRASRDAVPPDVTKPRDLTRLAAASLAAGLLGAVPGCLAVLVGTGDLTRTVALGWAVRNASGTYVVTGAALVLWSWRRHGALTGRARPRAADRPGAGLELLGSVATTITAGAVVFGASAGTPVGFLLIGVAAWIGFRFSPVVGAAYSVVFGSATVVLTLLGHGPFGTVADLSVRATVVQAFVAMTTGLVLMLALGVAEKNALADRLAEAEQRARTRAELLDAVTESMTDGLCVTDSWGHVVLANSAAAELAGGDEHGRHVHDPEAPGFLRPDGSTLDPQELPHARALRGERVDRTDVVRVDPATGQETILSTTAVPLHHRGPGDGDGDGDGDGEDPLAVVLLHDVTRERADTRMLQNFAGVVAHDLKGPLTGVLSWAEIAAEQLDRLATDGADVAELRASLAQVGGSAGRMSSLITDLLDYTLAGSAELHVHPVDLDELVDGIVADLVTPGPAPVVQHGPLGHVVVDRLLVRQLFANLLGNAVKYVEDGVLPRVVVESRERGDRLEVRVTDNGIGIPAADRGRVFDSFYRSASTGDYPGTGLGLAICARAVERHGGRISARPGPEGAGTTMTFTLPGTRPRPPDLPRWEGWLR